MPEGELPATYLGVPIHSRRLRETVYFPLLQNLRDRVGQWSTKKLSYAGRLQLLSMILMSIQRYWAQIFEFPGGVIHQIESICRTFLWSGASSARRMTAVSWSEICSPKETCGLGIKEVLGWNRASLISRLFDLERPALSSWCRWVQEYKLRGQSVCEVACEGASHSPSWRELMRARDFFLMSVTAVEIQQVREHGKRGRVTKIYEMLQTRRQPCLWPSLVWHSYNLSKVSMIMWLVCRGRLLTKMRMRKIGVSVDTTLPYARKQRRMWSIYFSVVSFLLMH